MMRTGREDSEYVGLGGGSPLMQNGLGIGGDCVEEDRGGESFCGEVSHINVTPSSRRSRDMRRQGRSIPLPTPTSEHRYSIFTWLPFAIIS